MFLVYINDLPEQLKAQTRLFADDTAVYQIIRNPSDSRQLQQDLKQLEHWESQWDMSFHPNKCSTLPVTRKHKVLDSKYKLHDHTLQVVDKVKYLGVTVTKDCSWDTHIQDVCSKANRALGFLRRNLKISAVQLKATAYKAYVRPILEYACSVWDPYTETNIKKLESVQRRAARFVLNRYQNTASVTEMIEQLKWPSLQHR